MTKAKFGVFLPFYALKRRKQSDSLFDSLMDIVLECEYLGYDSVWLDDHLMYGDAPILECWTALSALASVTRKIRLGTMVTSNAFRNPALLAKMAATVDVISNGRLEFGIGSGAQKEEHLAYGYEFSEPRIRINKMQETVEILKQMWIQEKTTYDGKYHKIVNAFCEPKPVQKPHPPITVGGSGELNTLRVTAKYADRFDFGFLADIEEFKYKMDVLENYCKLVGRNFAEIEKSCWPAGQILLGQSSEEIDQLVQRFMPRNLNIGDFEKYCFVGSPDQFAKRIKSYRDLGVSNFMLFFGDVPDLDSLQLFSETVGT